MVTYGQGGDLLSNFSLYGSDVRCHKTWDLTLTITGDLALTKDESENNRQRLLMWLAVPKGERLSPSIGCCLHDYYHAKITGSIARQIELDIRADLKSVFPDLTIRNIVVNSVSDSPDSSGSIEAMDIGITLGDDTLSFLTDVSTYNEITESIGSIFYHTGE